MADKIVVTTGKRKEAVARATIKKGQGNLIINGIPIDLWTPEYLRLRIREPLIIAGDLASKVDMRVNVRGGGKAGQTDSIRQSIARGLVEFYNDENLKKKYAEFDKNLLSYDNRRTEPHKPSRSRKGSRRHKQRSKR